MTNTEQKKLASIVLLYKTGNLTLKQEPLKSHVMDIIEDGLYIGSIKAIKKMELFLVVMINIPF